MEEGWRDGGKGDGGTKEGGRKGRVGGTEGRRAFVPPSLHAYGSSSFRPSHPPSLPPSFLRSSVPLSPVPPSLLHPSVSRTLSLFLCRSVPSPFHSVGHSAPPLLHSFASLFLALSVSLSAQLVIYPLFQCPLFLLFPLSPSTLPFLLSLTLHLLVPSSLYYLATVFPSPVLLILTLHVPFFPVSPFLRSPNSGSSLPLIRSLGTSLHLGHKRVSLLFSCGSKTLGSELLKQRKIRDICTPAKLQHLVKQVNTILKKRTGLKVTPTFLTILQSALTPMSIKGGKHGPD